ncbi:MAG: ABC transporter ATP-binding protein [Defluviitaleaceae bacterium]|nr:ABC transporter ATP-binding protein [Defluviitaleaceae bacterium]
MKISKIKKNFDRFSLYIEELDIAENGIYGIIGSNGCGKSTTMKIMAGLMKPDSGHVDYKNLSQQDITMVFRKPFLMRDTVIQNLIYPLTLRKIKPNTDVVNYYLEIAGLQELRNQYAPGLSGGEQQKLALIRAMIFSPKMIFIDEAFSNLDLESVSFFESLILARQQSEPIMYVICSHQPSHIKRLCDHVFFMDKGRIEAEGSATEMLANHKNMLPLSYPVVF